MPKGRHDSQHALFALRNLAWLAVACLGGAWVSCQDKAPGEEGDGGGSADSNADTGADADADADGSSDKSGQSSFLVGIIRDFKDDHIDFEHDQGAEDGIVAADLGNDGKPVYAGGNGTETTHGQEAFDQWYRDVSSVNMRDELGLQLTPGEGGVYSYDNQEFFPIDGQLFGNQGREHNYHFTFELHTTFTYKGGEVFTFTGDDDLWVFINRKLAIDLGGVHGPMSETADLDALASQLGIEAGNAYTLDFFFAERHTVMSTFRIDTTIGDLTGVDPI